MTAANETRRSSVRKGLVMLGAVLAVLALIVVIRTGTLRPPPPPEHAPRQWPVESEAAVARFAEALRIPTVSHGPDSQERFDPGAFRGFRGFLGDRYPEAHAVLELEPVSEYSLLYTWPGSDPTLDPVVLMGHFDVVPADPASLDHWTHPPFSGTLLRPADPERRNLALGA
jgi:carboxypeptidase PM20D1